LCHVRPFPTARIGPSARDRELAATEQGHSRGIARDYVRDSHGIHAAAVHVPLPSPFTILFLFPSATVAGDTEANRVPSPARAFPPQATNPRTSLSRTRFPPLDGSVGAARSHPHEELD